MTKSRIMIVVAVGLGIVAARVSMTSNDVMAEPDTSATTMAQDKVSAPTDATLQMPPAQVEELGVVRWERDFEQAVARSKSSKKPMLVLFTEVPGCSTVKGFGNGALSHPLIAEAIEAYFVPVAVYNNVDGKDREVLESFGEPTWNNPVVRIMRHDRQELAARFSGPYDSTTLLARMTAALDKSGATTPAWLRLIASEAKGAASKQATATFHMYCFWTGEAKLGGVDGVISSKTGFKGGKEVVQVTYDPSQISYGALLKEARQRDAADGVFVTSDAQASVAKAHFGANVTRAKTHEMRGSAKDDKYQLKHTSARKVPMTPAQASRVNAAIGTGSRAMELLSPRQRAIARAIASAPERAWPAADASKDFASAWWASVKVATTPR